MKIATLFAGCGGGDLGVKGGFDYLGQHYEKHPTKIVFANEWDKYACQTYRANFGADSITEGDICAIPSSEVPEFDILTGGFPCQSFSMAGKREGMEVDKGQLYLQIVRLLQDKQPKAFICENVKGLLSSNGGADFNRIYTAFKNCGYTVFFKVLNAANYGVPQKRKRVFIVGFRADLGVNYFMFPSPLGEPVPLKMVLDSENDKKESLFFSHKAVTGALRNLEKQKEKYIGFKKLIAQDVEKPCNTITCNASKRTCNSGEPLLKIGERYRRFAVLESQQIQSFPTTFNFSVSETQAYKQIGNAIAPVMMWWVVKAVLKYL